MMFTARHGMLARLPRHGMLLLTVMFTARLPRLGMLLLTVWMSLPEASVITTSISVSLTAITFLYN